LGASPTPSGACGRASTPRWKDNDHRSLIPPVCRGRRYPIHRAGDCGSEGFASTNGIELRLLGCCKPVPHSLQRMPESISRAKGSSVFCAAWRRSLAWCSHNSTCDDIGPTSCGHLMPARNAVAQSRLAVIGCPFVARSAECVQSPFLTSSTAWTRKLTSSSSPRWDGGTMGVFKTNRSSEADTPPFTTAYPSPRLRVHGAPDPETMSR
jgi:hypothetical protein